jgi:hypothetical protein
MQDSDFKSLNGFVNLSFNAQQKTDPLCGWVLSPLPQHECGPPDKIISEFFIVQVYRFHPSLATCTLLLAHSQGILPAWVCGKLMGKRCLSPYPHPALPLKAGHKTHLTQGV